MTGTSLLVDRITFVVAEITFKVTVIPSSVANITFVVVEVTFKVAGITSSVAKINFVVAEITFQLEDSRTFRRTYLGNQKLYKIMAPQRYDVMNSEN